MQIDTGMLVGTLIRGGCQISLKRRVNIVHQEQSSTYLSISQKLAICQCDGDPKPKIDPELPDFIDVYLKDTR